MELPAHSPGTHSLFTPAQVKIRLTDEVLCLCMHGRASTAKAVGQQLCIVHAQGSPAGVMHA